MHSGVNVMFTPLFALAHKSLPLEGKVAER